MKIGIVGHEAAKFTPTGKNVALRTIRRILSEKGVTEVVSGHCSLGGIDIWAEEIGKEMGLKVTSFPPEVESWEGGYKERNLEIANTSDIVHCIVVDKLPSTYKGRVFEYCYHCHTNDHIKSGGCWTAKQAKDACWHIIVQ